MEYLGILINIGLLASLAVLVISIFSAYNKLKKHNKKKLIKHIENTNAISFKKATEAINKLNSYAISKNPDFILGINRGGSLVGAMISLNLGIPSSNFIRCYVDNDNNNVVCPVEKLYGTVIIIDDISRTGDTLKLSSDYIKNSSKKIKEVITATLFTHVTSHNHPVYGKLDFFSFICDNPDILLPWNSRKTSKRQQYDSISTEPIEYLVKKLSTSISKSRQCSHI